MGAIYILTSPSGKQYVGITSRTAEERFKGHCADAAQRNTCRAIGNAIRKYGASSFTVKTLFIGEVSELLEWETWAISFFNTMAPNGYNLSTGGEYPQYSKETRKRRSKASKKQWADPAYAEKVGNAIKIAAQRPGARDRRAAATKKHWTNPAYRDRQITARKERWADPAYKTKQAAATKKRWANPLNIENFVKAKITWETARQIRERYTGRGGLFTQQELADLAGIHRVTIGKIVSNKTWKDSSYAKKSVDRKMNWETARQIRKRYTGRGGLFTQCELAYLAGVDSVTVCDVICNKTWKESSDA